MPEPTQKRSRTNAKHVTSHSVVQATCRNMPEHTQERSLIFARCVISHLLSCLTWRDTCLKLTWKNNHKNMFKQKFKKQDFIWNEPNDNKLHWYWLTEISIIWCFLGRLLISSHWNHRRPHTGWCYQQETTAPCFVNFLKENLLYLEFSKDFSPTIVTNSIFVHWQVLKHYECHIVLHACFGHSYTTILKPPGGAP